MPVYHFHHGSEIGWTPPGVLFLVNRRPNITKGDVGAQGKHSLFVSKCVSSESDGWTEYCVT